MTEIAKEAFKGLNVISVEIGKNVAAVGSKAFSGCAKLKTVNILSTKLTDKKVGADAFKGIHRKAVCKCPKAKLKAYKKWLPKKGVPEKYIQ